MDSKLLSEVILGNRPELFDKIWPVYKMFLEQTQASKHAEAYFLDRMQIVNDFYCWLRQTGHMQELMLIDRRSGADRRGGSRPGSPGRRDEDLNKPSELIIEKTPLA